MISRVRRSHRGSGLRASMDGRAKRLVPKDCSECRAVLELAGTDTGSAGRRGGQTWSMSKIESLVVLRFRVHRV